MPFSKSHDVDGWHPGMRSYAHALAWLLVILLSCNDDGGPPADPLPKERVFTNPILASAPDPWVVAHGGFFYVTHTTGDNIILYRTEKMSMLPSAEVKTVWTPPATGPNSRNIWAPELHFILGKWYLYYAADDGENANHRMWVLENSSADPFEGVWEDKGQVRLPDDRWAIDGTFFSSGANSYFLWSGWESDVNERQNVYISRMINPWTAEGNRAMLSTPELTWERHGGPPYVNEAPQFIAGAEKVFITYSASGCWTDEYSIGMLSAPATSDLLDAASWEKSPQPLLQKNTGNLTYGPGHNGFFKSMDGTEDWIVYHANDATNGGCDESRSMRMQKFAWVDGKPEFGAPLTPGAAVPVPSGE